MEDEDTEKGFLDGIGSPAEAATRKPMLSVGEGTSNMEEQDMEEKIEEVTSELEGNGIPVSGVLRVAFQDLIEFGQSLMRQEARRALENAMLHTSSMETLDMERHELETHNNAIREALSALSETET